MIPRFYLRLIQKRDIFCNIILHIVLIILCTTSVKENKRLSLSECCLELSFSKLRERLLF